MTALIKDPLTKDEAVNMRLHFACSECHNVYAGVPFNPQPTDKFGDVPRCDCGCEHIIDLREIDYCAPSSRFHAASSMAVIVL
jgi:hypothetical protein